MAYNLAVLFHHEVELWDKVGIAPVPVEHIVLGAAGTIDVPESLAGEVLYLTVILRLF
jgi:hypothetical protein